MMKTTLQIWADRKSQPKNGADILKNISNLWKPPNCRQKMAEFDRISEISLLCIIEDRFYL